MLRTGIVIVASLIAGLQPPPGDNVGYVGGATGQTATSIANSRTHVTVAAERPGEGGLPVQPLDDLGSRSPLSSPSSEREPTPWDAAALDRLGASATSRCAVATTAPQVPCDRATPAEPEKASGPRTPTLTDIASFHPATPSLTVEPAEFGIVGRPTNFVASARRQSVTGSLFDLPVTVQFTPVAYRFDYGDGASKTIGTGGSTWKAEDSPLFTRTATSHTYTEKALVTARVIVAYSARVAFTGHPGWYDVAGYVTAKTPSTTFQLYVARTVLVAHTCDENPRGPGCPGSTG